MPVARTAFQSKNSLEQWKGITNLCNKPDNEIPPVKESDTRNV